MKVFKRVLSVFTIFLMIFVAVACTNKDAIIVTIKNGYDVKNVIVFITDGVGFNHYTNAKINISNADFSARVSTSSLESVTDSAAASTAMATGKKVANGQVGIKCTKNISQLAIDKGKTVGIITTDNIYGATPSGFSARANNRYDTADIIQSQKSSGISLFMGQEGTNYGDERFITYARPTLRQLIEEALKRFESLENGFFLMAECSRTDPSSHSNDLEAMINELLDFKNALDYATEWMQNRTDTAILVTSDHETGGLMEDGSFTSVGHTATKVPFYAFNFTLNKNDFENTEVFNIMKSLI